MKGNLKKSVLMAMAGMIAAGGVNANNDKEALPIVNRPEVPKLVPAPSWTTPPDVFGRYYVGSTKWRHNLIKRKQLAKQQGRKCKR